MSDHKPVSVRRNYSDAVKREVVDETHEPSVSIALVARRQGRVVTPVVEVVAPDGQSLRSRAKWRGAFQFTIGTSSESGSPGDMAKARGYIPEPARRSSATVARLRAFLAHGLSRPLFKGR